VLDDVVAIYDVFGVIVVMYHSRPKVTKPKNVPAIAVGRGMKCVVVGEGVKVNGFTDFAWLGSTLVNGYCAIVEYM